MGGHNLLFGPCTHPHLFSPLLCIHVYMIKLFELSVLFTQKLTYTTSRIIANVDDLNQGGLKTNEMLTP